MPDSPQPWSTNATLAEIASTLRPARRVVVLTHVKPDGDAIGSTIALVRALNQPGEWTSPTRAGAWYFGPTPPWLADVALETPYKVFGPHDEPAEVSAEQEPDAIVVLDTGSWAQLEQVHQWLGPRRERVCLVDHHVQGDPEVAARRHIDTGAAAACQPVAELCRLLLNKPALRDLPARVAEACYLGIATDTGWFRHSNVSRAVMHTAGELLEAGADHVRLYQAVEQRETASRLKLLSRALATLELHDAGRIATMSVSRQDMQAVGAQPGESGGFVDFGQSIPTVQVTALFTEASPEEYGQEGKGPITKISLRSKAGPLAVDVNVVAKKLGGGGHVRAAGARTNATIEQTKARIVALLSEQLRAS